MNLWSQLSKLLPWWNCALMQVRKYEIKVDWINSTLCYLFMYFFFFFKIMIAYVMLMFNLWAWICSCVRLCTPIDFSWLVLWVRVMKLVSLGPWYRLGLSSALNCRDHCNVQFCYGEIKVVFQSPLELPAEVYSEFLWPPCAAMDLFILLLVTTDCASPSHGFPSLHCYCKFISFWRSSNDSVSRSEIQ